MYAHKTLAALLVAVSVSALPGCVTPGGTIPAGTAAAVGVGTLAQHAMLGGNPLSPMSLLFAGGMAMMATDGMQQAQATVPVAPAREPAPSPVKRRK